MNTATIRCCRQQWQDAASRAKRRVQIALSSAAEGSRLPLTLRPWTRVQWRYLPGDIADGWWLLFAEILAVLVLLALAWVTGPVATHMSGELEAMALAALARSDPLGLCLEGSTEDAVMRKVSNTHATVVLAIDVAEGQVPGSTSWKDAKWGRTPAQTVQAIHRELQRFAKQNRAAVEHRRFLLRDSRVKPSSDPGSVIPGAYVLLTMIMAREAAPAGLLWTWPAAPNPEQGPFPSSAHAFEAMLECQVIVGAYADVDLPSYVARECPRCDSSLKTRPHGGSWAAGQPIMSARMHLRGNDQGCVYSTLTSDQETWLQTYMSHVGARGAQLSQWIQN